MNPFKRLLVTHDPAGYTLVEWVLTQRFLEGTPHTFQLQVASVSTPRETDWLDVGLPAVNAPALVDDERREGGETFDHVWRVKLTTEAGIHFSEPARVDERLSRRDWLYVREMLRQARKLAKKYVGIEGWLLKRRRYGLDCPACIDPHTHEPTCSVCTVCNGTGIQNGYHAAFQKSLFAVGGLMDSRQQIDEGMERGTVRPGVEVFDLYGFPTVDTRDVFVEKVSGRRWFVERVTETAKKRSYVFKVRAEFRLAPLSDAIYQVPLELGS